MAKSPSSLLKSEEKLNAEDAEDEEIRGEHLISTTAG